MAIFQPTNIIPSSFTQGTVDVNDNMEISWQVNGNSAMTAFQIDFYKNDYASTPVYSTGKLPKSGETQAKYDLPFYGTDRFGRPQFFTYNAGVTWEDYGFTNGNNYKFKITQWYEGKNEVIGNITANVTAGRTYYFTVPTGNTSAGAVVYFTASKSLQNKAFFYSLTTGQGWYTDSDGYHFIGMTLNTNGNHDGMTLLGTAANVTGEQLFVVQTSSSDFITRDGPTLTIKQTNETYSTSIPFQNYVKLIVANELAVDSVNYFSFVAQNSSGQWITNYASFTVSGSAIPSGVTIYYNTVLNSAYYTNSSNTQTDLRAITVVQTQPTVGNNLGTATLFLATSIGYFVADYEQEQGEPIRWIRWQVATATYNSETGKWTLGDILADTGDIYTPTLNFEFNGFFNGNQYAIRCFGESESGQSCDTGWKFFNISFEANTYDGNFTAQCLHKENATLLEWEGVTVIPPTVSPEDYAPAVSNGSVALLPKNGDTEYSVIWDKVGNKNGGLDDMNFEPNWTAVWKGKLEQPAPELIGFNPIQQISIPHGTGYLLKYSPDGKLLLYYDFNAKQMLVYDVGESQLTLRGYMLSNGDISSVPATYYGGLVADMLFSANGLFAVSTGNTLFLYAYNNGFTQLASTGTNTRGSSIAFSPDGNILVRGGAANYDTIVYSVENNKLEPLYSLQRQDADTKYVVSAIDFNNYGTALCVGFSNLFSDDTKGVAVFEVNGTQITYKGELLTDEICYNLAFGKDTNSDTLIIATKTNYYQFKVVNGEFTLVSAITNSPIAYQGISRAISFSPDGGNLLIGGQSNVSWYGIANDALSYKGSVALPNGESWNNAIAIDWNTANNQIAIHNDGTDSYFNQIYNSDFSEVEYLPQGKLFELQENNISLTRQDNPLILKLGDTNLVSVAVPDNSNAVAVVITPTTISSYFYGANGLISQSSTPITYTQQPITSVSIYGGDSGATVDSVSVYQGGGSNILSLYENPDFEPVWNSNGYQLYMTANFNGNLEGGTGTASGAGFRVYRQEVGKNVLTPIANVSALTTSLKDYGISSRKAYKYSLYAYDSNSAFMGGVEVDNVIATNFKNYSLLVCDYDYDKDEYHVRKQYLFALNLSAGSVGNNNSPTLTANFTQYPTRMPSTQNYASGTLSGLIGAIYTVPALIEQIGQYKYTAKPSTLDYFDSVDLEKELYDLSTAPYQLFLRDMKGRLRMIATSGAISMTTNIKQKQQSISISFPWVEIGDASNVTIIQTPDDYGWNNDNQVLDVQLDVDVETGELSATYPFPYNGTKFYLTGVNKENLTAKTPLGVTPAQFNLSDTATKTTDGEVTATVTVNSEVDK